MMQRLPSPTLLPYTTLFRSREALLCAAAAASVASALAWLGPPGSDFAAHAYQRTLFLEHGFTLWNNFWYAGRDRKSTRLNSSHPSNSYAVFCLKNKKSPKIV